MNGGDPKRPVQLLALVLKAAIYGLLKSCDLAWRELTKGYVNEVSISFDPLRSLTIVLRWKISMEKSQIDSYAKQFLKLRSWDCSTRPNYGYYQSKAGKPV